MRPSFKKALLTAGDPERIRSLLITSAMRCARREDHDGAAGGNCQRAARIADPLIDATSPHQVKRVGSTAKRDSPTTVNGNAARAGGSGTGSAGVPVVDGLPAGSACEDP